MAKAVIQKKSLTPKANFFFNESFFGISEYQHGFFMKEILIYRNDTLLYHLKETNRVIWILRNCLYLISFILQLFLYPQYTIFDEKGKIIGYSEGSWFRPKKTFTIDNNQYNIRVHKNNSFSLTKNSIQIALYEKKPFKWLESRPDTYYTFYNDSEPVEIIGLFCIFIDLIFFTDCGGRTITNVFVPYDPHPECTRWRPDE